MFPALLAGRILCRLLALIHSDGSQGCSNLLKSTLFRSPLRLSRRRWWGEFLISFKSVSQSISHNLGHHYHWCRYPEIVPARVMRAIGNVAWDMLDVAFEDLGSFFLYSWVKWLTFFSLLA